MVASTWQWDSAFMFATFGGKAALAVKVNASVCAFVLRHHVIAALPQASAGDADVPVSRSLVAVHLGLLAGVVLLAHHPVAFLGLFLLFLGFTQACEHYQSPLIVNEALLVAFFLAGLVALGGMQSW